MRSEALLVCVKTKINKNHCVSLRDVTGSVRTSPETICKILLKDFNLSKVFAHMVLQVLITDQKGTYVHICLEWLEADEDDDIFSQVITGDESWLFEYDIQKNGLKWSGSAQWTASEKPWTQFISNQGDGDFFLIMKVSYSLSGCQ